MRECAAKLIRASGLRFAPTTYAIPVHSAVQFALVAGEFLHDISSGDPPDNAAASLGIKITQDWRGVGVVGRRL